MPPAAPSVESRVPRVIEEIGAKGDFPAATAVIQRLREAVSREQCTALDIARVVLQDPGLSSKVLRLVNSAFYRQRGNPVSTITRAVILLGFGALSNLTSGLLLLEELTRLGRANGFVAEGVRRSLLTGLVSQSLAVKVGYPTPEEAYLLGLFANLGALWVATFYPEEFEQAATLAGERGISFELSFTQLLGVSPGMLSAAVLEHWNFPPSFSEYFRHPHARERAAPAGGSERLAAIVDLAAEYATAAGDEDAPPGPRLRERFHTVFSLPGDQLVAVTRSAREAVREQAGVLGVAPPRAESHRPSEAAAASPPPAVPAPRPALGLEHAAAALAVVGEITRALLEQEDLDHPLTMVLEGIGRIGRFDLVVLARVDGARRALVARLAYGEHGADLLARLTVPLAAEGGLLARTALAGLPQKVPNGAPRGLVPAGAPLPPVPPGSYLATPLVVRGEVQGVVLAVRAGASSPEASDLGVVQLFCDQASLALGRRSA